ncbi:MAG: hypothetical protein IJ647_11835 [Prevotella sp.]|nr:hypothetical protein [Prevotella sp.]
MDQVRNHLAGEGVDFGPAASKERHDAALSVGHGGAGVNVLLHVDVIDSVEHWEPNVPVIAAVAVAGDDGDLVAVVVDERCAVKVVLPDHHGGSILLHFLADIFEMCDYVGRVGCSDRPVRL